MRTAIYARVSTEGQEKQETINSQLADLRNYASQINMDIVEEYIDNGYSGELFDRPALDKLRDDAKNRLFSALLVHSPDRLSRKFIHGGIIQEELKKYGITVIFFNKPNSGDTPEDNLLNNIQAAIAEYEKAKILERTRRGKIHKARSGIIMGSIILPKNWTG
jgi:site-specific DNA recombinase